MIKEFNKILIIAPHLDDETIAMGGTIKRLTQAKLNVHVIIVGGHLPPQYNEKNYLITKKESEKALKILGVKKVYYFDLPALEFHKKKYQIMNSKIFNVIPNTKEIGVFNRRCSCIGIDDTIFEAAFSAFAAAFNALY